MTKVLEEVWKVKAGGKQRSDATHVLAAIRVMKHDEAVGRLRVTPDEASGFDLYEDTGGHNQTVQGLDGAGIGLRNVDDSLMGANLELLT